jgi:hypothetical protein
MDGWDKVFTAGKHTDSAGNVKQWTTADLDLMASSFNPNFHEPPVTIGHPSDNAPAFGWVAGIKRVGNDLYLSYRDVAPQFKEWVAQGLYKKKSIAVYPNGSLRHIGYLGAMPPAIKGLPDFQFKADQEFVAFDCSPSEPLTLLEKLKLFIENLTTNVSAPDEASNVPTTTKEEDMTKEEVQAIVNDSVKEFSELLKTTTETLKGLSTQFGELKTAQDSAALAGLKKGFAEFLETPEMQKRIPEGGRESTINQLVALSAAPAVEFGEGDAKKSISAVESYKQQLKTLPEVVAFGELATKANASDTTVNGLTAEVLSQKAVEFQESEAKSGRTVSMTSAVAHIKAGGKTV